MRRDADFSDCCRAGGPEHLPRCDEQQHANQRIIDPCRDLRGASDDGKRQPENNERVGSSPRDEAGLCETNHSDGSDKRVQGQCRRPDDVGRVAGKPIAAMYPVAPAWPTAAYAAAITAIATGKKRPCRVTAGRERPQALGSFASG